FLTRPSSFTLHESDVANFNLSSINDASSSYTIFSVYVTYSQSGSQEAYHIQNKMGYIIGIKDSNSTNILLFESIKKDSWNDILQCIKPEFRDHIKNAVYTLSKLLSDEFNKRFFKR